MIGQVGEQNISSSDCRQKWKFQKSKYFFHFCPAVGVALAGFIILVKYLGWPDGPVSQSVYLCGSELDSEWRFVITVIIFVCVYHLFILGEWSSTLLLETSAFVFNISENTSIGSIRNISILKFTSRNGQILMTICPPENWDFYITFKLSKYHRTSFALLWISKG